MSGPEEVVREALQRAQEIELSEFTTTRNPAEVIVRKWTPALSALDALVAERDKAYEFIQKSYVVGWFDLKAAADLLGRPDDDPYQQENA